MTARRNGNVRQVTQLRSGGGKSDVMHCSSKVGWRKRALAAWGMPRTVFHHALTDQRIEPCKASHPYESSSLTCSAAMDGTASIFDTKYIV